MKHPNYRTKKGFRSGYEERIYENALGRKLILEYEKQETVLHYTKPARKARYLPDFELPNGILIEAKGRLTAEDRSKMLNVKRDNPASDIRFLFMRANQRITKSKNSMTYEQWADKHGFRWSIGETIPDEWWDEKG